MNTLLTPESSSIHKFVFDEDKVSVTFTYNLDKSYTFVVNQETTTVNSVRALIEIAGSKGKALAELRRHKDLIPV